MAFVDHDWQIMNICGKEGHLDAVIHKKNSHKNQNLVEPPARKHIGVLKRDEVKGDVCNVKYNIHDNSKEKVQSKLHGFLQRKTQKLKIEPKVALHIPTPL
jgi:hypothetical protein